MKLSALDVFSRRWAARSPELAMVAAAENAASEFASFLPIDPRAVAARFGASVAFVPIERTQNRGRSDHGNLTVRDGRWHIAVPLQISSERRRFSVAHEIAHILLFDAVSADPSSVRELRSQELYARVERLCNTGAAHLLMPEEPFAKALELAMPPTRETVEMMASKFSVSLEAVARRITEVRPDWSVMFWEHTADHPKGAAWRTTKQPQRDGYPYQPDGMSSSRLSPDIVAAAAATGAAQADEVLANLPSVDRMNDVRAWFIPRGRRELVELDDRATQNERVFVFFRHNARA